MSINVTRTGRTIRISLKGALALGSGSGSLSRAVRAAIETGARTIQIDASGVRFLDASGLGELVACRKMAERAGVELRLCAINGKVRDLLKITRLDRGLLPPEALSGRVRAFRWRVA
ncbi:MAG TPA: STAS domain-containing protein [Candidatus Polarisedimenticolia bacterium]|jgi:anti-anti-sigma factor